MTSTLPLAFIKLDFESTGVDPRADEIIEVAVVATDVEYNELTSFQTVLRATSSGLARLQRNEIALNMHMKSGLFDEVYGSTTAVHPTLFEVETRILALIEKLSSPEQSVSLGGGGVSHYDRIVIQEQMPALSEKLTYWSDDVSAARRSYERAVGRDIIPPTGVKAHRAMDDIREDLRYDRAFRALYINSAKATADSPLDRALSGLALVGAFNENRVVRDGDTTVYAVETAQTIETLLATTGATDVIFGLMDVASSLLSRLAAAEGTTTAAVVDDYRDTILGALASAADL